MGRRPFEPFEPDVVQVCENRGDRTSVPFSPWNCSAPHTRVEMLKNQLIHLVVHSIGFEEHIAKFGERRIGSRGNISSLLPTHSISSLQIGWNRDQWGCYFEPAETVASQ